MSTSSVAYKKNHEFAFILDLRELAQISRQMSHTHTHTHARTHTHTHARTHARTHTHTHIHTSMYKLYQMTYKTSKPQINKLHAANQLTDLVLSG